MAFVNEFVPEKDIQKYKLDRLWLGFHPEDQDVSSVYRFHWTVDRERDAFFIIVDGGGREEDYGTVCVLYWKEQYNEVRISKARGGSLSFDDAPYQIIWDLFSINRGEPEPEDSEMIQVLKEALVAHGCWGIYRQIPNTVVEFNF